MKKINLLSVIILFLIGVKVNAQVPLCGLDDHPKYYPNEELRKEIDEIIAANNLRRDGHGAFYIRIYLHVSRRSDGTNDPFLDEYWLPESLSLLENTFAPEDIFFIQGAPIDYIDNDERYNSEDKDDVWYTNSHEDGIDIYYHPSIEVNGIAQGVGSLAFIVRNDVSYRGTFIHEMGHCLGLYHTHETFLGAELVDGSNAAIAGDLIADTPADPNLIDKINPDICSYTGTDTDANGDLYNPLTDNFMSYAGVLCTRSLTPGQLDYCRATLLSNPILSSAIIEYPDVPYTYIEDDAFRSYLIGLGVRADGPPYRVRTDDIKNIGILNIANKGISSLVGIEDFTALITLDCSGNNLTTLNLSSNPSLITLDCSGNDLITLNLNNNLALNYLDCSSNTDFDALNLWNNENLRTLICNNNALSILDVSLNPELVILNCDSNNIDVLNIYQNPALINLDCANNRIIALDISRNPNLVRLEAPFNDLTYVNTKNGNTELLGTLNVTNNPALRCIEVDDIIEAYEKAYWLKDEEASYSSSCFGVVPIPDENFEATLRAQGYDSGSENDGSIPTFLAESITTLEIDNKDISSIEGIEYFTLLRELYANDNNISDISSLSDLSQLRKLNLSYNNINNITPLADLDQLTDIYIDNNNLSGELDFSGNPELVWLRCYNNYEITGLNLSSNTRLERLQAASNSIEEIDLSNNLSLIRLHLGNNSLTELDVSLNSRLTQINCQGNNLTSLNVKNGGNRNVIRRAFDARNNPDLTCIQVDNPLLAALRWFGKKDRSASFKSYCSGAIAAEEIARGSSFKKPIISSNAIQDVAGNQEFNCTIYPNPVTNILNIKSNMPLEAIHIMNMQGTKILTTTKTSIDFSYLPSGIYILNIVSGNNTIYQRIVKQ